MRRIKIRRQLAPWGHYMASPRSEHKAGAASKQGLTQPHTHTHTHTYTHTSTYALHTLVIAQTHANGVAR